MTKQTQTKLNRNTELVKVNGGLTIRVKRKEKIAPVLHKPIVLELAKGISVTTYVSEGQIINRRKALKRALNNTKNHGVL